MKRLFALSTALIFAAEISMAAVSANDLVTAYQAQGYTKIEVTTGLTEIKVEAIKGNAKVEVIYDATTGAILKQEQSRADRDDRGTGVEIKSKDEDFLDDDDSDDDDGRDDDDDDSDDDKDNSGHGGDDDDDDSDDDSDEDGDDDDHSGSDDDHDDDHEDKSGDDD